LISGNLTQEFKKKKEEELEAVAKELITLEEVHEATFTDN
jgi:hypothetical protein